MFGVRLTDDAGAPRLSDYQGARLEVFNIICKCKNSVKKIENKKLFFY